MYYVYLIYYNILNNEFNNSDKSRAFVWDTYQLPFVDIQGEYFHNHKSYHNKSELLTDFPVV